MATSRIWIQALENQHAWPDPKETMAVWMGNMSLTWSQVGTDFSGRMSQKSSNTICKETWCCEKELSNCAMPKNPGGSSDGPKKIPWLPWSALEHSGDHCKTRCLKKGCSLYSFFEEAPALKHSSDSWQDVQPQLIPDETKCWPWITRGWECAFLEDHKAKTADLLAICSSFASSRPCGSLTLLKNVLALVHSLLPALIMVTVT